MVGRDDQEDLLKYIILESAEGMKLPFMFPEIAVHADMAELMKVAMARFYSMPGCKVISAGFCEATDILCHGESESLNMKARPEIDAATFGLGQQAGFLPDEFFVLLWEKAKARRAQDAEDAQARWMSLTSRSRAFGISLAC